MSKEMKQILTNREMLLIDDSMLDNGEFSRLAFARAIEAAILKKIGEAQGSLITGNLDSKWGMSPHGSLVSEVNDNTGYWRNRGYEMTQLYAIPFLEGDL